MGDNKRRILVTGGSGYVGGRVCQALAQSGFELGVTYHNKKPSVSESRNDYEYLHLDLDQPAAAIPFDRFETIVHLASLNDVRCRNDEKKALEVNGISFWRFLKSAIQGGVSKCIYFSTALVYGNPPQGKITETTPTRPVDAYGISHRLAEDILLAVHQRGEIDGAILRLSNAVGVPASKDVDRWSVLVNDLCRQAVSTGRLKLRTDGRPVRDFVCLEDVGRAVAHLLNLPLLGGEIFNLGGERTLSVLEVANLVSQLCKEELGYLPSIELGKEFKGSVEIDYRMEKLKSTGFRPTGQLEQEIKDVLVFCTKNFSKTSEKGCNTNSPLQSQNDFSS